MWGVVIGTLWLQSARALAQPDTSHAPTLMTSARAANGETVVTPGTASTAVSADPATGPARLLPLFGERGKTAEQIDFEINFLNDCDRQFASRAEASRFFSARGWEYLSESQLDTATYRFNLAWLLDNRNPDAYWGLGVVCYQHDRLPDAIRLLNKGATLADSDATLLTDLATLELQLYRTTRATQILTDAQTHLRRAVLLRPDHAAAWQKLSLVHFQLADYQEAWACLHKTRILDLSLIDFTYLNDLLARMPDPQGVFR
jgi:tetratricopeptide (TPR) repeat protein